MNHTDCLLCRIVNGDLHARKVIETARIIGVMNDAEPFSKGHIVFFPKRHTLRLNDMDDQDLAEILVVIKRVAAAMKLENYNVLQNNGSLAGQTVFHAHFHLIPKWSDSEGLKYGREFRRELDHGEIYQQVQEALARLAS
ncbi:MAG: HIT family protein [Deltaproteobacteria bacterium]|nr:HIT family protein [Deltaproteobacteria bacterium]